MPEKFRQRIISNPDAVQMQFYLGHVGIRRDDPDYFKLMVMDYILGTGPGFTDRLSARLRDREGLAYTVNANITTTADLEPGVFSCYIGTDAGNFERVKKEFLEELEKIRTTIPEEAELADAKNYLLGNLPFRFTTNAAIASQLLMVERLGVGLDYLDKFRKEVAAVTGEDIKSVASRHIQTDKLILLAVGAIDETGKPLPKK
jgi:zinc protease